MHILNHLGSEVVGSYTYSVLTGAVIYNKIDFLIFVPCIGHLSHICLDVEGEQDAGQDKLD